MRDNRRNTKSTQIITDFNTSPKSNQLLNNNNANIYNILQIKPGSTKKNIIITNSVDDIPWDLMGNKSIPFNTSGIVIENSNYTKIDNISNISAQKGSETNETHFTILTDAKNLQNILRQFTANKSQDLLSDKGVVVNSNIDSKITSNTDSNVLISNSSQIDVNSKTISIPNAIGFGPNGQQILAKYNRTKSRNVSKKWVQQTNYVNVTHSHNYTVIKIRKVDNTRNKYNALTAQNLINLLNNSDGISRSNAKSVSNRESFNNTNINSNINANTNIYSNINDRIISSFTDSLNNNTNANTQSASKSNQTIISNELNDNKNYIKNISQTNANTNRNSESIDNNLNSNTGLYYRNDSIILNTNNNIDNNYNLNKNNNSQDFSQINSSIVRPNVDTIIEQPNINQAQNIRPEQFKPADNPVPQVEIARRSVVLDQNIPQVQLKPTEIPVPQTEAPRPITVPDQNIQIAVQRKPADIPVPQIDTPKANFNINQVQLKPSDIPIPQVNVDVEKPPSAYPDPNNRPERIALQQSDINVPKPNIDAIDSLNENIRPEKLKITLNPINITNESPNVGKPLAVEKIKELDTKPIESVPKSFSKINKKFNSRNRVRFTKHFDQDLSDFSK